MFYAENDRTGLCSRKLTLTAVIENELEGPT